MSVVRILGLDLESTGLDTANDWVTELGAVLWDVETKRPLVVQSCFLYDECMEPRFTPESIAMMKRICGITPELLKEFGQEPSGVYHRLDLFAREAGVEYICAHNGENFDKPMLYAQLHRLGVPGTRLRELPWIDTRTDLPFAEEPDSRKLKHLALDSGFISNFAHRAVFDVLTMLRILSNYPIEDVIAYSKIPFITVRAVVSYDNRELAKAQRYSWEKIGERTFPKCWVKRIKQDKLNDEIAACKFEVVQIP